MKALIIMQVRTSVPKYMYERKKHFCPSVCKYILWLSMHKKQSLAQGPHSHILMTEGGGGSE